MNDYRLLDPGDEQTARDLRLRIGRTRRRIGSRLRAAAEEGRRLRSWRTYVARYTGSSLAVAFGAGLALAAGLSSTRLLRWIALRSIRQGMRGVGNGLIGELSRLWNESRRGASTTSTGKENVDG